VFTLFNPLNIFVQHTLPPAVGLLGDFLNNHQHESNMTLISVTGHARSPNMTPIDKPYTSFCCKFGSRLLPFRDIGDFAS